MPEVFWFAIVVLAFIAIAFVTLPLANAKQRKTAIGAAIVVAITAAGLYASLGTVPSDELAFADSSTTSFTSTATSSAENKIGTVASMVDGLAEKLKIEPDDGKSWLLLAQSYEHLGRIPEAIDAYKKAQSLGQNNAGLDILLMSNAENVSAQIYGRVTLSENAKEQVLPTDTVFVFARASEGPMMPLAVLRRPASELPIDFLLNDDQAMSADTKLSTADHVVVTARITRTGVATETLQNLEAQSGVISVVDNNHISLNIE